VLLNWQLPMASVHRGRSRCAHRARGHCTLALVSDGGCRAGLGAVPQQSVLTELDGRLCVPWGAGQ
jgi:hypothetical protein